MKTYDIIVIGAGHAGCEACLASSRMGLNVLLVTMRTDTIGQMSCNPAVGGVGKGQLVKEVDALGGEMAKATDATGIHFRILNRSRGPAVWSSRAQVDRHRYAEYMRSKILSQQGLEVLEDEVVDIVVSHGRASSIKTLKNQGEIGARAIVVTPGTFLNGCIHIGLEHKPGGRFDEPASVELSRSLKELGFEVSTLKTGTTPRLRRDTIDFSNLKAQPGDDEPVPFSYSTVTKLENKAACYITYTNLKTHQIIRDNLDRSPLYTGIIRSTGVRYCPSIEDKVVRFCDRDRHQVFLEPEGLDTDWYYPNGISTSLPLDVQVKMLHSIEGLKNAEVIRPGYGIEYEFVQPTELLPTLQTKRVKCLFLAGQINGTTGYEEAAAQGLIAGINAALYVRGKQPFILKRSDSYIGVLIDDLITKGTDEPYRMFTSRVEYRLMLREDNADLRLREYGYSMGIVSEEERAKTQKKRQAIEEAMRVLNAKKVFPTDEVNDMLRALNTSELHNAISASELLRRPQIHYDDLKGLRIVSDLLPPELIRTIELLIKYDGFIKRQMSDIRRMQDIEKIKIPPGIDFSKISGLSSEIEGKLEKIRPLSLGQASRICGFTPAATMALMVYLKKNKSHS